MPFSLTFTPIEMSEIPPPTNTALPFCPKSLSTTFFVKHYTDGKKQKNKSNNNSINNLPFIILFQGSVTYVRYAESAWLLRDFFLWDKWY